MKIILLCTSGISSGYYVRKIQNALSETNIVNVSIEAMGYYPFTKVSDEIQADYVFIGPADKDGVQKSISHCTERNIPYCVLDSDSYSTTDTKTIVDTIISYQNNCKKEENGMENDANKIQQSAMLMIAKAGEGKSLAVEAIHLAKQGKEQEAKQALEKAEEAIREGHVANANLLWSEANGDNCNLSILLVHAMDHIMNANTFYDIAVEVVDALCDKK